MPGGKRAAIASMSRRERRPGRSHRGDELLAVQFTEAAAFIWAHG